MKNCICPSCGAEIVFQFRLSSYAVCSFCRTMVVRHDDIVKNIGVMATLPEDMSPFQIGTEGYFGRMRFGVMGRMKISWGDGSWNEWFIVFDDGSKGWLAEAQGFYAVCQDFSDKLQPEEREQISAALFEVEPKAVPGAKDADAPWGARPDKIVGVKKQMVGKALSIGKVSYKVVDIKRATCIGSEGELPFAAPQGRETVSVDLTAADDGFASIERDDKGLRVFVGRYLTWKQMRCVNYRLFEGW